MASQEWMLIYTKPRAEMKLTKKLTDMGFEVYCPTYKTVKQWSDRKKKIEEPLFRSYIFVKLWPMQMNEIHWVPGFSRFVYWLGKPATLRDKEIEATRMFLEKVVHDTIVFEKLSIGQDVTVISGVLKKMKGKILSMNKKKAILQIDTLGTIVKAELPLSELIA